MAAVHPWGLLRSPVLSYHCYGIPGGAEEGFMEYDPYDKRRKDDARASPGRNPSCSFGRRNASLQLPALVLILPLKRRPYRPFPCNPVRPELPHLYDPNHDRRMALPVFLRQDFV